MQNKILFSYNEIQFSIILSIDYNCLCDPGFLVTNLGKKMTLKWSMLGSIYNSVHFSQNFITC